MLSSFLKQKLLNLVIGTFITFSILLGIGVFVPKVAKGPTSTTSIATTQITADILFIHADIVSMDSNNQIYTDGWLAIKDGKIMSLGDTPERPNANKVIDSKGAIIFPGFIDTHAHLGMSSLTNKLKITSYTDWLINAKKLEATLTPQDIFIGTKDALQKISRSGVTTINDMYFFPDMAEKAALEFGLRIMHRIPISKSKGRLALPELKGDLSVQTLDPNPITDYSLEDLKTISEFAKSHDLLVHIHFESDPSEKQEFQQVFNLTPLEVLVATGLINNRLVLAHALALSKSEIFTLKTYPNISISTTPRSEQNLSKIITPVNAYLEQGIQVTLGTDSEPSAGSLDMLAEMYTLYNKSKCKPSEVYCDKTGHLNPEVIVEMATKRAALSLGLEDSVGSLQSGKSADLVIVDKSRFAKSTKDPFELLVQDFLVKDINSVYIAGKLIK